MHNGRPDRYFAVRYYRGAKRVEEGIGWASEDFNAQQVANIRSQIIHNIKTGSGPQSFAQMQGKFQEKQAADIQESDQMRRATLTLTDIADHYLAWAKKNKKSWREDEVRINRYILPYFKDIRLQDLDRQHGLEFIEFLKGKTWKGKPLAPATIKQYLTLARRMIYFASDTPMPGSRSPMFQGDNPFRRIKMPKLDNVRWRYLTYDEAKEVLRVVKEPYPEALVRTQNQADRLWLICRFSLHTGARLSEVLNIRPEHVFSGSSQIRLVDTKYMSRTVYPDDETMAIITALLPQCKHFVFESPIPEQPISRHYVGNAFSKIVNAKTRLNTGVTDARSRITFHSLRHTYGTWQIYGGMDIETLSRLMGHTDLRTTRRYVHLAEEFKAQMAARARIQSMQVKMP